MTVTKFDKRQNESKTENLICCVRYTYKDVIKLTKNVLKRKKRGYI